MRVICFLLLSVMAQGGNPLFPASPRAPRFVTVSAGTSATAVKAGGRVSLFVDIVPNAGIHVYAPGAKDYRPITLDLEPSSSVAAGKTVYPKSEILSFEAERIPVYQQPFRLARALTVARATKAGVVTVAGTVNYQACDDKVCYAPASVPVNWMLTVNER